MKFEMEREKPIRPPRHASHHSTRLSPELLLTSTPCTTTTKMVQDYAEYLAINVLNEQQLVSTLLCTLPLSELADTPRD